MSNQIFTLKGEPLVIPTPCRGTGQAPVGIQSFQKPMDSGFRRNDSFQFLPLLLSLLKENHHPRLQMEAAWALWKLKDPQAISPLLELLETSRHDGVRCKVVRSLGLLRATEALEPIRKLAKRKRESKSVRQAAVFALGCFSAGWIPSFLASLLGSAEEEIRAEAVQSLSRHLRRDPTGTNASQWVTLLKQSLHSDRETSAHVRATAVRSLRHCLNEEWVTFLISVSQKDMALEVRAAALEVLLLWQSPEVESCFCRWLESCDWPLRCLAAHCLARYWKRWEPQNLLHALEVLDRSCRTLPKNHPAYSEVVDSIETLLAR